MKKLDNKKVAQVLEVGNAQRCVNTNCSCTCRKCFDSQVSVSDKLKQIYKSQNM